MLGPGTPSKRGRLVDATQAGPCRRLAAEQGTPCLAELVGDREERRGGGGAATREQHEPLAEEEAAAHQLRISMGRGGVCQHRDQIDQVDLRPAPNCRWLAVAGRETDTASAAPARDAGDDVPPLTTPIPMWSSSSPAAGRPMACSHQVRNRRPDQAIVVFTREDDHTVDDGDVGPGALSYVKNQVLHELERLAEAVSDVAPE